MSGRASGQHGELPHPAGGAPDDRPRGGAAGPVAPAAAARVFAEALPAAERYVARLAGDGVVRGLIGPREVPRLWERHVLNSAAVAEAVPQGARVVDVGSGAGLPGIPLGLARPDLTVTLVEPMARRVDFLEEAVAELAQLEAGARLDDRPGGSVGPRWRVVRGRAEDRSVVGAVGTVDVVTARAVAPLPRLVGWCRGLMRPGTQLVALVGTRAVEELPALLPELAAAGMRDVHARAVGAALGDAATTVVVMTRGAR
ncbi:16S rRNA (guanine(527)-N(7))-methyltransferase RsmG [Blastococcus sp. CT_GayMR19]|uniref:16S rRNA (guanine(527)-N(7))-methyltransferase RsmG n=1 Tax=Blastococcus sp. CT_GayMR19 TaxID=2559608 RepID=UPI001FD77074|nr:16S rRNA (guanine(527)-N(7))-methyltransferase RsmG [Blastococcus sp. CT_GayMR19]